MVNCWLTDGYLTVSWWLTNGEWDGELIVNQCGAAQRVSRRVRFSGCWTRSSDVLPNKNSVHDLCELSCQRGSGGFLEVLSYLDVQLESWDSTIAISPVFCGSFLVTPVTPAIPMVNVHSPWAHATCGGWAPKPLGIHHQVGWKGGQCGVEGGPIKRALGELRWATDCGAGGPEEGGF